LLWFCATLAIGIEAPAIVGEIVAKDINVSIVGADFKALVTNAVPLVHNFPHFKIPGVRAGQERKTSRPLIGPKAGIAFHFELHLRRTKQLSNSQARQSATHPADFDYGHEGE
jgi:hypothetical protein